jgi:hypothetical protein
MHPVVLAARPLRVSRYLNRLTSYCNNEVSPERLISIRSRPKRFYEFKRASKRQGTPAGS